MLTVSRPHIVEGREHHIDTECVKLTGIIIFDTALEERGFELPSTLLTWSRRVTRTRTLATTSGLLEESVISILNPARICKDQFLMLAAALVSCRLTRDVKDEPHMGGMANAMNSYPRIRTADGSQLEDRRKHGVAPELD